MSGWTGSYVPVAGDVIALKRGVEWRKTGQWVIGQSGSSTGQIVYTAYGTGAKPKYTVLEDNSSGWTLFAGSVYRHAVNTATGDVKRLFIDGVGMGQSWATSTNTSDANWVGKTHSVTVTDDPDPGNGPNAENGTVHDTGIIRYWAQITDTTVTPNVKWLYLYSPGAAPGAGGQKIEVVKSGIDSVVVLSNRSYVTVDNIALSGGVTAAVNIGISDPYESIGLQVTNCDITCTRGEGIRVWSTSTVTAKNGLIKWNTLNSSAGTSCKPVPDDFPVGTQPYGFKVYPSPDGDGGWENGITLYNGCENWTVAQNDVSNFWHTQISVLLRALNMAGLVNNVVEHNDLHAEKINYAHGMEVVCATGSSPNESAQMEKLDGNILRYNKVHDTWVNDKNEGKNTKVYGNLIYRVKGTPRESTDNTSWGADGFVMKGHDSLVTGGVFAYNTIVDVAGPGLTLMANRGGIPIGATVANNIFYNCGTRTKTGGTVRGAIIQDLYWSVTSTDSLQVDNNCLFDPSFTLVYEKGSGGGSAVFYDVPGMEAQQTSGTWNFNRQENPSFTDYAHDDFTLTPTSLEHGNAKDITSLIPESAGWTNIGCWQDAAATPATTFVSAQALSSNNWNDYTGWKGMKITVGSTPVIVTDLGRWVVSGNNQTHTLKIVNASGTTVASTSVALSGAPAAQYKYAALSAPVTLAASSVYYIVSSETNLGDYLVGSGTVLTHTGAATVNCAVRSTDSVSYTTEGTTDNCSGPLNFKYYLETNFVTGQALSSTSWNDYTGWKGMKITVGSAPIVVTQLGRWVLSGNTQAHTVKIVDNTGTTVGSVSVATSGAPTAQMKYVALSTPVVLSASSVYYIVSQETNGGDFIWGSGTVLSHTSAATINNAVRSTDSVTYSNDGTTDNCSGPVAFKYY